ncbi:MULTISPECIES: hypothetical protein [unclassified Streptomyces]|uniref:hypothetical protein n=1 Tax=unclassified Streptomyces TaxID=2593676 RepID=UPI0001C192FF|nr:MULTISPECIES: hypothetical protein [unclassified Streptomyces]AEN09536.1 hypothetical protein SACTE_1620 [Streptomyces sp. SirexAA-E]MYR70220.1 hypothetical protein [Streptomyces sp. SID4939]MYS03902.1 hypothetical protein [Streptomyces sp. SID4940]MYT64604.1 hypothetical protein [Streptomyces sp. SID8357]MYT87417.1 hypothetical protein [Streptomyces sp. SID8360]
MSKSRNSSRLAKQIRRRTALTQSTASRLAKQVRVRLPQPIADASEPRQRRLEAHMAHVLASRFQDRQLNGALLGVQGAQTAPGHLGLTVEPTMADEVLRELLPRLDDSYGGLRGVPGLRVRPVDGGIVLQDSSGSARVFAETSDGRAWRLPTAEEGETPLWTRPLGDLSSEEHEEAEGWAGAWPTVPDAAVRDLMLSRVLRRPGLVNRASAPHGFANCYTHHSGDLVIEWCCGDTVEAYCAALLAHGFVDGLPPSETIELTSAHSARLGGHTVIVRRHSACQYDSGPSAQKITDSIEKGYSS